MHERVDVLNVTLTVFNVNSKEIRTSVDFVLVSILVFNLFCIIVIVFLFRTLDMYLSLGNVLNVFEVVSGDTRVKSATPAPISV